MNANPPPPRRDPNGRRTPESVAAVIDQVPSDFYIRHPGRGDTLHWSDPAAIRRDVISLDVPEGGRILELGTGTGYSSAVLAALTGPTGRSPPSTSATTSPAGHKRCTSNKASPTSPTASATASPATQPAPASTASSPGSLRRLSAGRG